MIESVADLRQLYPEPKGRAIAKQLDRLDVHCRRFIGLSPFAVLATTSGDGRLDSSPRGGDPGFVHVRDDRTLWLPDASGNNRLDSLSNVVETGRVGLLFLIPGVDETLRVNGAARVCDDAEALGPFDADRRTPRVVLEVTVEEAYLHCAKALMRSRLWSSEGRGERSGLPTMGEMLHDQIGGTGPVETQADMVARYARDL
ncbi:MAG TPA: pyridoxamine 5'-phosphate oxidase family protein [Rubricoccaceae bacterium]